MYLSSDSQHHSETEHRTDTISRFQTQRSRHVFKVFRVFIVQISQCLITTLSPSPQSQLRYLTLAIMQGFGSVGGCLGLGLEGEKCFQLLLPASALCLNKSGEGWSSPFGARDRAYRCGHTRQRCRTTNRRGPLDYTVALQDRWTSNQTRAPWICRKGFLRRAGLLHLLREDRGVKAITISSRWQSQLRPAGRVPLSLASGQPCLCSSG